MKTKVVASFVKKAELGEKVLFVAEAYNAEFLRAARNIPGVEVLPLKDLNALVVLKAKTVVFEKAALDKWIAVEAI